MKVKVSKERKSLEISFRTRREALERADFIDSVLQIEQEERDFVRRLAKRRPAGIG